MTFSKCKTSKSRLTKKQTASTTSRIQWTRIYDKDKQLHHIRYSPVNGVILNIYSSGKMGTGWYWALNLNGYATFPGYVGNFFISTTPESLIKVKKKAMASMTMLLALSLFDRKSFKNVVKQWNHKRIKRWPY